MPALRPAIEPRDPKATKIEDIRLSALLRRQRMSIVASQEGMILSKASRTYPPTVGMRALPRVRLDPMVSLLFQSVGISPNGGSIAKRAISATCIIGMLIHLISDIQRARSPCPGAVCEAGPPVCYHRHSAFLGRNVRLTGMDNIRMLAMHILAEKQ